MTKPKFGDRVRCLQKLRRTYDFRRPYTDGESVKVWSRVALAPRVGLLIGYRTLCDVRVFEIQNRWGHTRHTFEVVKRHRVALVVFSGAENPVYVPVDAMSKEG